MLLSCQICQCFKRSPGKICHQSHSKISYLSHSESGEHFWLLSFQFLFFCSSIRSAFVHMWTLTSVAGRSLGRKCRPTSWTGKGMFSNHCRRQSCSHVSVPLATFCGENYPQCHRSHSCGNLGNASEISILQILGQCPQLHNYSCFPSESFMQTATLPNPNPTASTSAPSSHALQAFSIKRAPVLWEVG